MAVREGSGNHRALQDMDRRMVNLEESYRDLERRIERELSLMRGDFKKHSEQDVKMHMEVMEALQIYHFANLSMRTIKWLAIVGAGIAAVIGMIKGVGK